MRHTNAIIINSSTSSFQRNNPEDPLISLPWEDIDIIFTAMLADTLRVLSQLTDIDILVYRNEKEISDDFFLPYHQFTKICNLTDEPLAIQIRQAIDDAFANNYQRVMVMLENNPILSPQYLKNILAQLEYDDDCIVVGSTYEGKYHLVGMKSNHSQVFDPTDGDPLNDHSILLKKLCQTEAILFLTHPINSISYGKNILSLRKTIESRDKKDIDFPSKTLSIFKLLEKKYRYQKIFS